MAQKYGKRATNIVKVFMMTSSNGNIFRVIGFCAGNSTVIGEFPSQRPVTRSFDFFLYTPEQTFE